MTTLERFSQLIELNDRTLRHDLAFEIRKVEPEVRASIAAFHITEALARMIPVGTVLIKMGKDVFADYEEKIDKSNLMGAGWSIVKPLVSEGLLGMQRESGFLKNDTDSRQTAFKRYEKIIRKANTSYDKTQYMFCDGDAKDSAEFLDMLGNEADIKVLSPLSQIYKYKPLDWEGYRHPDFGTLSSRPSKRAEQLFWSRQGKKTLNAVNKLQGTAFKINENVYNRMLKDKVSIQKDIQANSETHKSMMSKLMDLSRIMDLASENLYNDVYSPVNLDFRGRTYYTANTLNRSGSDWAKGLLGVEPEEIGDLGYDNLLVAAIDFRDRGTEAKMSRAEKLALAETQVSDFIAVAEGADYLYAGEPAQFLAVCYDIKGANDMGMDFENYKSGVLLSRDASQSGPMLMGIATQDEMAMKYTNVLEDTERHDLYEYMGGVMLELLRDANVEDGELPPMPTDEWGQDLWYVQNKKVLQAKAKADFLKLFDTDPTALRKWAKYPLMLFGYSAEELCIASDLYDKMHHKYDWLTVVHCHFIADLFYKACEKAIPSVYAFMQGMKKFGMVAHKADRDVEVVSSYGGWPFVQKYRKQKSERRILKWTKGDDKKRVDLNYLVETEKRDHHAIQSGTPANLVHSIDSDLLKMVVNEFDGTIATNHDAFFTTPARVSDLDVVLRNCTYKMGTEYDLVDNAISQYGVTADELGIVINELHPNFNPMANEFCYA